MIRYVFSILLLGQFVQVLHAGEAANVIPDSIVKKVDPSVVAVQHRRSGGSGFIISADGYILTNGHVVTRNDPDFPTESEDAITVILDDDRKYPAKVIGFSLDPDVALLKIDSEKPLKPVQFADSRRVTTGQKCFAVGMPVGLKRTFTSGILSNVERADLGTFTNVLQTDAAINPGNSGGPLFDEAGHVLGINTYGRKGSNNIGFTIPIHVALKLKDDFLKHGRFVHTGLWFCVMGEVYDELAETLDVRGGVLVRHVEPGTAVAKAGLRTGDVIVDLDGKPCSARTHAQFLAFRWELATREPGSTVKVNVIRGKEPNHKTVSLTLPLSEFTKMPPMGYQPGNLATYSYQALGLAYQNIVLLMRLYYNLPDTKGVVVTNVYRNSPTADAEMKKYDIITHVAGNSVTDSDSFERVLEKQLAARTPIIPITIQRQRQTIRTALVPSYDLNDKTAVVLVGKQGFKYLEMIRRELLADGVNVKTHIVDPDSFKPAEVDLDRVDMLILCDDATPSKLITDKNVLNLIKTAHDKKSVLAAVGGSSLALVKAVPSLLKKRMTTSSEAAGEALKRGATYTGKDVEEEDKMVTTTGRNRRVMKAFVKKLCETSR